MAQIEVTEESLRTAVDEAVFAQAVTLADKVAGFSAVGPQIEAIVAAAHPHGMSMQVGDQVARMPHGDLLAIARTTLLAVLQQEAENAGVHLRFGERRNAARMPPFIGGSPAIVRHSRSNP